MFTCISCVQVDEGVVVEPIAAGGAGAPEADVSTQRAQSLESTRTIGVLPVNFDALTEDALTMFSTLDPSLQEIVSSAFWRSLCFCH